MKELSNYLILSKGFQILANDSFKCLYKRAKCYRNGVKMANFFFKSQKSLSIEKMIGVHLVT